MNSNANTGLNRNKIQLTIIEDKKGNPVPIIIQLCWVRCEDPQKPYRATKRKPLDVLESCAESQSYYLGRQPLSQFMTVPHFKKVGVERMHYFTQLEMTAMVPSTAAEQICCFSKRFYPAPGELREIYGFELGDNVLFSNKFPIKHLGQTANSKAGTDENENNLYISIRKDDNFITYSVSIVIDQNGAHLVVSQPYYGDVFVKDGEVCCPMLEDEQGGKTRGAFLPLVQSWFDPKKLKPLPEGYRAKEALNVDCLPRGGNQHGAWVEAYVHMESAPRQLSFGLFKQEIGKAGFAYIAWDELPGVKGNIIRRIPVGTFVKGKLNTEPGGRFRLTNVTFLSEGEMLQRTLQIRDPDVIAGHGESKQEPEWVQKKKVKRALQTQLGVAFAGVFAKLSLPSE